MAEYIEREKLQKALQRKQSTVTTQRYTDGWNDCLLRVKSMVHSMPAADVAPVRRGEWTKSEDDWHCLTTITCSECHEEWCFEMEEDVELLNYRYCPNCGARMDLGGTENGRENRN